VATLFARATRRISRSHFRHVRPVPVTGATGLVASVYDRVESEFGMLAPPVVLHSPAPATLAASWMILREVLLAPGLVPRRDKEAVAAAVSRANSCPYCVDVHATTLSGLVRGHDPSADPRLAALDRWAAGPVPGVFPFPPAEAPELLGTALTFHYINRMVNVFLLESPLPPVRGVARNLVQRGAARVMRRLVMRTTLAARGSTDLLPAAALPADLFWTAGRHAMAEALARATAAIDAAGDRRLPAATRDLVTVALADPGRDPGTVPWLHERLGTLPPPDRPAARLALLTAVSSYRVTDAVVGQVRATGADDATLIEVTSWASMAAARHTVARLAGAVRDSAAEAGGTGDRSRPAPREPA
jgi:AhpD family alkylhydroperoxidase